jgi:catechol 2,3-dioxygenase-like lactoylglutathione lyase family enzyme
VLGDVAIQRMDNVAIVVGDLDAAVAFFAELGMELEGKGQVEGPGPQTNPDRRAVLTCKEPAADAVSGSKPEHETKVADAAMVEEILRPFGLEHLVAVRGDVRAILGELRIGEDDLTTEQYTDAALHASA